MRWIRLGLGLLLCCEIDAAGAGVRNHSIVSASSAVSSAGIRVAEAVCPAGTFPLGGGADVDLLGNALIASFEALEFGTDEPIGWFARAREIESNTGDWRLDVRAVCGNAPGLERTERFRPSNSDSLKSVTVQCPAGKSVLGGGGDVTGSSTGIAIHGSHPFMDLGPDGLESGWRLSAFEAVANDSNWGLRGVAVCADVDAFVFEARSGIQAVRQRELELVCPPGYVATSGGSQAGFTPVDWIRATYPSIPDRWLHVSTRAAGDTSLTSITASIVCPEPGPTTSVGALFALLVLRSRRTDRRARLSRA